MLLIISSLRMLSRAIGNGTRRRAAKGADDFYIAEVTLDAIYPLMLCHCCARLEKKELELVGWRCE